MKNQILNRGFLDDELPNAEKFFNSMSHYSQLMMMYEAAIKIVMMRFEMITNECNTLDIHCPIRSISSRIKKPFSITKKLEKKNVPLSIKSVLENLNDVAGVRVICPYIKDIYILADILKKDEKITICELRDYIKNPKPNGYRSLHLITDISFPFLEEITNVKCEIQLRTTAMDSWAALEHNMRYKKNKPYNAKIDSELKQCAQMLFDSDIAMQHIAKEMNVLNKNQSNIEEEIFWK